MFTKILRLDPGINFLIIMLMLPGWLNWLNM